MCTRVEIRASIKKPKVTSWSSLLVGAHTMQIGQIAKLSGCTVETVRYYEKEGLIATPERQANGYRHYNEAHLAQLVFVRHCRSLNLPLEDIQTLQALKSIPEQRCHEISELVESQIGRIERQIESLQLLKKQLHTLSKTCNSDHTVGDCMIVRSLELPTENGQCSCHAVLKNSENG